MRSIDRAKLCPICKKQYFGHGNNAQPVAEGRCCDQCNMKRVLPARVRAALKTQKMIRRASKREVER